ncbi:hypothetical protein FSC37_16540 [Piscinibacter aquaticus]|uniref:Uncharacterized protein n=1 Tax=Piscinibacter aquaticus TaxID=392597 RepID=A0A5C6U547_9BURK|nr:hypothetical protein FSC37_16540 [Piscinibacter aquaticus]
MYRCFAALLASLLISGGAFAQSLRAFTPNALRGTIEVLQSPEVALNGKPARLAASARIFGPDNLIKVPASIVGQKLVVNYTLDGQGFVRDVWVLTESEAAKKPWPTTAAEAQARRFDSVSQVWIKP